MTISPESVSYWDVDRDKWRTPTGNIPVLVGASVEDIRLRGTLAISNRTVRQPDECLTDGTARVA